MDKEYTDSVDASADVDVSDVDVADDIPSDIPDDVPEDISEGDYSEADVSDDISEDSSDETVDEGTDYEGMDDSFEDDSIEPKDEGMNESLEGFDEDSYEDSGEVSERYEESDDIPEDVDENGTDLEDENTDVEDIPEDTESGSDINQEESFEEGVPEDAADTDAAEESTDVEDTDTAEPPDVDHGNLETYDYETSHETKDTVIPESSGECASSDNPYSESWEKFGEEFSGGEKGSEEWDSLKDVPSSKLSDANQATDATEINSISDYMNAHNYGPATAFPDDELPPLDDAESFKSGSDTVQDVAADDKASEYIKTLKDFCESNGYIKNADFSDFDPHVAYDLTKSVLDAKTDFPDLQVNYLGSIDHQVKGLHDTVEASQFDFYKQNGFDEGLAQQMAKQYADDFIRKSKLDDTEGIYAWSLRTGNPSLDKFDGVAVNNDYAKDYLRFKSEKQADEIAKWAPIGCGNPKAVADHELGHEIDHLLGASNDNVINNLYSNMMKENQAENKLSGYSKKNVKEFIAEAYSEYRNNSNPREVSRSVYNRLIELRNQKYKQGG